MNLFQIDEAITNCVKLNGRDEYVDVSTGEIIDVEALKALEMERDTKIRNIACWIRNLDAEEKALADQEKIYKERKTATKNKKESLKAYLSAFLQGQKWKNKEVQIGWRESDAVEITGDVNNLPEIYLKYAPPEPNKTLLKADIKSGKDIPGVVLVKRNNIQIK